MGQMALTRILGKLPDIHVQVKNSVPKLYSYVIPRDYGFAPNPFIGSCTLATCKPLIRKFASVGDWIVGTGSRQKGREGSLVFVMQVTETMSYNEYWHSSRFRPKRPNLRGSIKQAFGDNIYYKDNAGKWHQANSHHSYRDGSPNQHNILHDTQADRVLISSNFAYWGKSGPKIPQRLRDFEGIDLCAGRGHKCQFPTKLVEEFVAWFKSLGATGYLGAPSDWE